MNRNATTLLMAAGVLVAGMAAAQRGDDAERASKNGSTECEIDGVGIVVDYGRPSVKDRNVWGGLVPYGEVWRTGADEATTVTLAADAMVEGESLAVGTYSLFTIPGEGEWTVIFNKTAKQWGAFRYDDGSPAALQTSLCDPFKIVYLGFGLEGVSGSANREEILTRSFDYFAAPPTEAGLILSPESVDSLVDQGTVTIGRV